MEKKQTPKRCVIAIDPSLHLRMKVAAAKQLKTLKSLVHDWLTTGLTSLERKHEDHY
jgi:predicted HicB family RNase H-like nuclease